MALRTQAGRIIDFSIGFGAIGLGDILDQLTRRLKLQIHRVLNVGWIVAFNASNIAMGRLLPSFIVRFHDMA